MNKVRVSKKEMKENYYIISAGYCDMQFLLRNESPLFYSAGVYGWSCDYYLIKHNKYDEVIISTGYSPIDSKNTCASYELIKEYEIKANAIWSMRELDYKKQIALVDALLYEFIEKALNNGGMKNE